MKAPSKNKSARLARIATQVKSCRRCRQRASGNAVIGEGSSDPDVVFVGEAPGRMEAESGRPFVGRAGQWLRRAIQSIGLDENSVYLTSALKYRPAHGKPSQTDIAHGRIHLLQQLDVLDPRIIVLLGNAACLSVLGEKVAVHKRHGSVIERNGRIYLITSHPSAARFPAIGKTAGQDFEKLKELLRSTQQAKTR